MHNLLTITFFLILTFIVPSCSLKVAADIAFLIDGSGSVGVMGFRLLRSFILEVVREFQNIRADLIRVAIVQYNNVQV